MTLLEFQNKIFSFEEILAGHSPLEPAEYIFFHLLLLVCAAETIWYAFFSREKFNLQETYIGIMSKIFMILRLNFFVGFRALLFSIWGTLAFYSLFKFDAGSISEWLILFILVDFMYYWYHRLSHRFRILWIYHAVHHSLTKVTVLNAIRKNIFLDGLVGNTVFYSPLILLGFNPVNVLTMIYLNLSVQIFLHFKSSPNIPVLNWLFNSPYYHLPHHSNDTRISNANYGGILIIFDRLFGTFREPIPNQELVFGNSYLAKYENPKTWLNILVVYPLRTSFQEIVDLICDIFKAIYFKVQNWNLVFWRIK